MERVRVIGKEVDEPAEVTVADSRTSPLTMLVSKYALGDWFLAPPDFSVLV